MVNVMQNRQENKWKVTKVIKEHTGHMIGPDVYGSYQKVRQMSDNDLQMITELRLLEHQGGKLHRHLVTKQVINQILISMLVWELLL